MTSPSQARRRRRRRSVRLLPLAVLLAAGAVLTAFPFLWMLTTAVKPLSQSRRYPPEVLPTEPTLASFRRLFEDLEFGQYLINTVIVVLISFVGLLLMAMAGYGFAKFRFRGSGVMFALVLATMMVPVQVTMIPTYLLLNSVSLTNSLVGIALPALVSAFGIFLFRQFMVTIPNELLEAARLDGASEARVFTLIVLPMSRPILAVQAMLTFIAGWNSFLWPLIIANDEEKYTLAVGLSLLNQQLSVNPPLQMAGASLMVVPILIVYAIFSRHVVSGFTMSGTQVMMSLLRARDARLEHGDGEPVLLRGVGLGNWLLPEGYMWKFEPPGPQSPREIEALLTDLVGDSRAAEFWAGFRARFITDADLARIAAEGMNHVRLPINSRVLLTQDGALRREGFATIDWLIDRCRIHRLWVVLDLHGAPGGQTGTNIDDSPRGLPELFTERHYQEQTIELWRALAMRYRDEPVVAGYDLLNEPLPNEYQHRHAADLVALYGELTEAIRSVDPDHLIIYEGTHWASNWDIFTEVWDPKSVLQFHRYWSPPDRPGIQRYLDTRDRLGLPIYMGEGGENNLDWLQTAFQLYEDEAISWNFWPWKKLETLTSPCSVVAPAGWTSIVEHAAGKGARPDPEDAWRTLSDLLDGFDIERCVYRSEVINAVLRRSPIRLPGTGFSFRGEGRSYQTSSGTPLDGFRPDDRVTIVRPSQPPDAPLDFSHTAGAPRADADRLLVRLEPGDWVSYDVHVPAATRLEIAVRADAPVRVRLDDIDLPAGAVTTTESTISPGRHDVRLSATQRTLIDGLEIAPVR